MTPVLEAREKTRTAATAAAAACMGVLLIRPWLAAGPLDATVVLIAVFAGIWAVGAWWPLPADRIGQVAPVGTAALVTAAGVAAFAAGRLVGGDRAPTPALAGYVVLNTLAAVAEEALFRRLVYDVLSAYGSAIAVVGSAAAFALIHITVWGPWVLPIDFAAGLILSWQRKATGRWSVPAVTHAAANLLAVL